MLEENERAPRRTRRPAAAQKLKHSRRPRWSAEGGPAGRRGAASQLFFWQSCKESWAPSTVRACAKLMVAGARGLLISSVRARGAPPAGAGAQSSQRTQLAAGKTLASKTNRGMQPLEDRSVRYWSKEIDGTRIGGRKRKFFNSRRRPAIPPWRPRQFNPVNPCPIGLPGVA